MNIPSTARRHWARQLIQRQTPTRPRYGSTAWLILPNEHPDKVAACVIAAECWASMEDNLEDDLRREIEGLQLGHKHAEDAEYLRSFARHIKRSGGLVLTTFEERRARQIEAAKPQADDRPGGTVVPETGLATRPPGEWDRRFWDGGDAS